MSVQFGRWNVDGSPIDLPQLEMVKSMISSYGPDNGGCYVKKHVALLYCALHTTNESLREAQPLVLPSGSVITWDGRLDNRDDLIRDLRDLLTIDSTDVEVFASAYQRWGTACFGRIIGDWAVAIWESATQSLLLARDFVGVRQLYYLMSDSCILWSTVLDPLLMVGRRTFKLNEEYIAGWLSFYPAAHLTPYTGIQGVPPSSFVRLGPGRCEIRKYWDFDASKRIFYSDVSQYEEHFRSLLRVAVQRRLRCNGAILAELSGGMDSSSLVCLADRIIAGGSSPRLDTVSFYSNAEPNWNEQPFFSRVEQIRGRRGHHINLDSLKIFEVNAECERLQATPGYTVGWHNEAGGKLGSILQTEGIRVVLSGLGGDEIAGGVPTGITELQDLVATGRYLELMRRLTAWALSQRRPWFRLLWESLRDFFPIGITAVPESMKPAPWLNRDFVERNRKALEGYPKRLVVFGPLPSFQANLRALDTLRRQRACDAIPSAPAYEKRYPYLDRDLLEFIYAIPRQQIVRPGHRRYLMRRALAGIVPDEILARRRKAFVARGPRVAITSEWASLTSVIQDLRSARLGIVDRQSYAECLHDAQNNAEAPLVRLMRTLFLELWLKNVEQHHVSVCISNAAPEIPRHHVASVSSH